MNKYVVYTVLTGEYEEVLQPVVIDERFDYILFSNDYSANKIGVWSIRNIPQEVSLNDNKRLSRYPKTHPECLLSEYETSLYIDANIQIADTWVYERVVELAESGTNYAGIKLRATGRDDIYRHAYDICVMKAEHDMNAIRQCHALYKNGYPEHWGLNENNIIFRSHTEIMRKVDEEWWWWITNYSYRDQFSYMYCLWKYGVKCEYFLPEGLDAHNSSYFLYTHHNNRRNVAEKKWVKAGFFENRRNRNRLLCNEKYERYCRHWVFIVKLPYPQFFLFMWGISVDIWNLSKKYIRKILRIG